MANVKPVKKTAPKSSATKKETFLKKSISSFVEQGNINQRIAEKAYDLYLKRGGAHGNDVDDWLAAERIIAGQAK